MYRKASNNLIYKMTKYTEYIHIFLCYRLDMLLSFVFYASISAGVDRILAVEFILMTASPGGVVAASLASFLTNNKAESRVSYVYISR